MPVDAHRPVAAGRKRGTLPPWSPLVAASEAFALIASGPGALGLPAAGYPGLPNRVIELGELRRRLLSRSCGPEVRDAVWRDLVSRSRTLGGSWTVGCAGMALPVLTVLAGQLTGRFAGDAADVHAEVLSGFLAGLATVDLTRPGVISRLRWCAYRAGYAALREALDAPMPSGIGFGSAEPPPPCGHPDFVLAEAVHAEVISQLDADLIGATRLERVRLRVWASEHNVSYEAVRKARQRAERRLVAYLLDDATAEPSARRLRPAPASASAGPAQRLRLVVSQSEPHRGVLRCGKAPRACAEPEAPRCA